MRVAENNKMHECQAHTHKKEDDEEMEEQAWLVDGWWVVGGWLVGGWWVIGGCCWLVGGWLVDGWWVVGG